MKNQQPNSTLRRLPVLKLKSNYLGRWSNDCRACSHVHIAGCSVFPEQKMQAENINSLIEPGRPIYRRYKICKKNQPFPPGNFCSIDAFICNHARTQNFDAETEQPVLRLVNQGEVSVHVCMEHSFPRHQFTCVNSYKPCKLGLLHFNLHCRGTFGLNSHEVEVASLLNRTTTTVKAYHVNQYYILTINGSLRFVYKSQMKVLHSASRKYNTS